MKIQSSFESCAAALPRLLSFSNGSPVASASDWPARRAEIAAVMQNEEYGTIPPRPADPPRFRETHPAFGGDVESAQYVLFPFSDSDSTITVDIFLPSKAKRPLPAILTGDGCWTHIVVKEAVEAVTSHGFALVSFNRCHVVPDYWQLDPSQQWAADLLARWPGHSNVPPPNDTPLELRNQDVKFATIAGWAWGFSRVMDMLELLPFIDAKHVGVTGHSRGGKAALLAGAFDQRFFAVSSNGSGSAGSACWRFSGNGAQETIEKLTGHFPTWLLPSMKEWSEKEDILPFDQHFLKAMVAPRPLIVTEAESDEWANPKGSLITNIAAAEVYKLLGEDPSRVAYRVRPGTHAELPADFETIAAFFSQFVR